MDKALTKLKEMQESHAIATIPGRQPDNQELLVNAITGDYAVVINAICGICNIYNYMPELSGKIAIALPPVFQKVDPSTLVVEVLVLL